MSLSKGLRVRITDTPWNPELRGAEGTVVGVADYKGEDSPAVDDDWYFDQWAVELDSPHPSLETPEAQRSIAEIDEEYDYVPTSASRVYVTDDEVEII